MNDSSKYSIRSLIKAVHILELLVEKEKLSIAELSKLANHGKSTIHRVLGTFKELGYVDQNEDDGKYYATIKLFELGNRVANRIPIKKVARPYLEELYESCHETVNLAILDKGEIIYLDKIITKEPLRIDLDIGRRVPVYCSALGKSMLAFDKGVDLTKFQFESFTDKTIASREALEEELNRVRDRGYALDDEEYIRGLICVAVPILDKEKKVLGAISIATPAVRVNQPRMEYYISSLEKTAEFIQGAMIY